MITSHSRQQTTISRSQRKGFSLVEVLIVIAIIAVLAGIAIPVAGNITKSSKIEKNREIATALELGIERFYNEYGYLPAISSPAPTTDEKYESDRQEFVAFLEELAGEGDSIIYNSKGTNFISALPEAKSGRSGILRDDSGNIKGLINSFGGSFGVIIDYTYDEEIDEPPHFDSKTINGVRSLIWAFGEERDSPQDTATSWR